MLAPLSGREGLFGSICRSSFGGQFKLFADAEVDGLKVMGPTGEVNGRMQGRFSFRSKSQWNY